MLFNSLLDSKYHIRKKKSTTGFSASNNVWLAFDFTVSTC